MGCAVSRVHGLALHRHCDNHSYGWLLPSQVTMRSCGPRHVPGRALSVAEPSSFTNSVSPCLPTFERTFSRFIPVEIAVHSQPSAWRILFGSSRHLLMFYFRSFPLWAPWIEATQNLPSVACQFEPKVHDVSHKVKAADHSGSLSATFGYGSKLNHQGTAGFSLWFHLPGLHFGYAVLTHNQFPSTRAEVRHYVFVACYADSSRPGFQGAC